MKQDYELVLNNRTIGSYPKCREGLDQAYRRAEEIIADRRDEIEMLAIYCVYYSASGEVEYAEFVDEWEIEDMTCIDDRMVDHRESIDTTETEEAIIADAKFKGAGECEEGYDYY